MELDPDFADRFGAPPSFDQILSLQGEVFRSLDGRRTLRFSVGGKSYFIKIHLGIGWKEIVKNLLQFKIPVMGAENEMKAIRRIESLGVPTMKIAGYGRRGTNPARLQSFLVTDELIGTISLEDFTKDWPTAQPSTVLKRALIDKVASISRTLHENGVNHRDFYICHFLLEKESIEAAEGGGEPLLFLIDLHRTQLRGRVPERWIIKDVSGLFFSSMDVGLTSRDYFRFLREYRQKSLRTIFREDREFLHRVYRKAVALYQKDFSRMPVLPVRCV